MQTLGPEQLTALAAHLRQRDFPVSTAQVLTAQRLVSRLAEHGQSKPAAELGPWLGPIFSTSRDDLRRFATLYEDWQSGKAVAPPPPPPPRGLKSKVLGSVAVLVVVLAATAVWRVHTRSFNPVAGPKTPTTILTGPTTPSTSTTPSIVTAVGTLVGNDGTRVGSARLLVAGDDSVQSDANGAFRITGMFGEPVLATHCDYDAVLFPLTTESSSLQMVRKARSACTTGVALGIADPRAGYQRVRMALSALPMAAFLAWLVYVVWRRIGLRKWRGAASSRFAQLPLGDSANRLFSETELQRSVQELRRPRPIPLEDMWPERTVAATVENAGWFTPVYRARRRTTEYLVLIDRMGKRDQQARFGEELIGRLKDRGVYAHVYYFQSDPRTCTSEAGTAVRLTDIAARFGDHELWVLADGADFYNPFTGRRQSWVDMLHQWQTRVLLTTVSPVKWGVSERRTRDQGFELVHASPRGVARIVDQLVSGEVILDSYPSLLEDRRARWISNEPPTQREIRQLRTELRLYLGRDGFRWLVACAEYPVIEWPLALYLGRDLMPADALEPVLRKLVRLPWFRHGSMPLWLREALVRIDKSLRARVLGLFATRLNELPAASAPPASPVEVAIERDYKQRVDGDDVWLSFLWRREPDGLVLPAAGLRRLLFSRGRVWLGPRPWVALTAAVISSVGIWTSFELTAPRYRPEIERIALDIALSQYHNSAYYAVSDASGARPSFAAWCYQVTQRVLGRAFAFGPAFDSVSGTDAIAGTIARLDGDDGIAAGAGWTLTFQGDRVAPRRGYSPHELATLSDGALPPLPATPSQAGPQPEPVGSQVRNQRITAPPSGDKPGVKPSPPIAPSAGPTAPANSPPGTPSATDIPVGRLLNPHVLQGLANHPLNWLQEPPSGEFRPVTGPLSFLIDRGTSAVFALRGTGAPEAPPSGELKLDEPSVVAVHLLVAGSWVANVPLRTPVGTIRLVFDQGKPEAYSLVAGMNIREGWEYDGAESPVPVRYERTLFQNVLRQPQSRDGRPAWGYLDMLTLEVPLTRARQTLKIIQFDDSGVSRPNTKGEGIAVPSFVVIALTLERIDPAFIK